MSFHNLPPDKPKSAHYPSDQDDFSGESFPHQASCSLSKPLHRQIVTDLQQKGFTEVWHGSKVQVPYSLTPRQGSTLLEEARDRVLTFLRGNSLECHFDSSILLYNTTTETFVLLAYLAPDSGEDKQLLPYRQVTNNEFCSDHYDPSVCLQVTMKKYPHADKVRIKKLENPYADREDGFDLLFGNPEEKDFDDNAITSFSTQLDEAWRETPAFPGDVQESWRGGMHTEGPFWNPDEYYTIDDPYNLRHYSLKLQPRFPREVFEDLLTQAREGQGYLYNSLLKTYCHTVDEEIHKSHPPVQDKNALASRRFYWINRTKPEADFSLTVEQRTQNGAIHEVHIKLSGQPRHNYEVDVCVSYDSQRGLSHVRVLGIDKIEQQTAA